MFFECLFLFLAVYFLFPRRRERITRKSLKGLLRFLVNKFKESKNKKNEKSEILAGNLIENYPYCRDSCLELIRRFDRFCTIFQLGNFEIPTHYEDLKNAKLALLKFKEVLWKLDFSLEYFNDYQQEIFKKSEKKCQELDFEMEKLLKNVKSYNKEWRKWIGKKRNLDEKFFEISKSFESLKFEADELRDLVIQVNL
ncbi:hypothetical protein B9Z55_008065 [Caenorhabditis nigoni]|uniref:DUF38 domain-containing protein n=1 Tax=Caenorhabditis nigoni TaxID=1611254 RepID=A0A2G5VCI8_9PELO|nr:hypothetical protein B9Z55_008065 [Caenorhabditis nigoni]